MEATYVCLEYPSNRLTIVPCSLERSIMSEFELIEKYFKQQAIVCPPVILGIGDDCALLRGDPKKCQAITTDMLVEGRHFFKGTSPLLLGRKALAVNLSDLAAMGAQPVAFTLALALPQVDTAWLQAFSQGLFEMAHLYGCQLIGGDTTKGPLTISITALGEVAEAGALRRDGAKVGDDIWVSGTLGDARFALEAYLHQRPLPSDVDRLHAPTPRVLLGMALSHIAHAAIDLSDGLVGDLTHLLKSAQVSGTIMCDDIPMSDSLALEKDEVRYLCTLSGGDDYELCFTAPASAHQAVLDAGRQTNTRVTKIGYITPFVEGQAQLQILDRHHQPYIMSHHSFDHFL